MSLPNVLKFHTVAQGDFVYNAEKLDAGNYRIYWGSDQSRDIQGGSTTYETSFMHDAFARKVWVMKNIESNEDGLTLLFNDEEEYT
jgi:hypothetical protein